ncbi:serine--tRNA ligase [Riemerella anatipestifer]|uniref:Serine--tRNA ligase n=1 Tax=Riemerella anatipestifer (strain ATCC 11845 / DSM 15868 / JCM 9532 / NCTC 11014) TaxID=693978 RepID=E4TC74_RIEAD|nr:serine--tRNA ligase [Riemerella anatipestifer]ADQ82121.1 seryl-tRNA synthetase [Riemerella anatipestifer ATCC 11845 = DSM 15868]ADZ12379.1 Seryl-tRNA synthetase [Riemerella anatipestifer RA-GD]AFD56123.1 seryl-tRNA synthetase [Riemerella anatipestifer ATCC 11845 = DSM 15868]AGC39962.1 Seryl-tRNA synthetase [Riemerella anatipestifer RA-CH-2]AKP69337.1 seryl-tRNA synthetase [Riemerella anatipestifer]
MLQVQFLREQKSRVLEGLKKRNFKELNLVDEAIATDDERKKIQYELDENLAQMNKISKEIGLLMKEGKKQEAEEAKTKTGEFKQKSQDLQQLLKEKEESLLNILYQIPNIPADIVKAGSSADDNEVVYQSCDTFEMGTEALPHWELAKKYNLIDFELGVKIAGAGFPVYLGKGARLQRALVQFFLDKNTDAGYLEVNPPHVVNEASGYGTGQLPDKEGQMYFVNEDNLYLIPTAEVPVTNIYRDVILEEKKLPVKNTAFSQCYRREAGSYGADVRGLNRLHQFEKVEIVRLEKPENSYTALDEMVAHVKSILEDLELPFRILRLCGGDMGFTSALTYDFEVWSAAQQRWLEVSSVSNFESFQANRLKCRYKSGDDKPQLVHTLNGSAMALPRVMAALLENNQTEEGVKIPEKLRAYTRFESI